MTLCIRGGTNELRQSRWRVFKNLRINKWCASWKYSWPVIIFHLYQWLGWYCNVCNYSFICGWFPNLDANDECERYVKITRGRQQNNWVVCSNAKCAMFTVSRSQSIISTNYTIGGHVIERKDEIRDLGIILDRKFTFGAHIETITASARQMIGYIKRVSSGEFTKDTQRIL